MKFKIKSVDLLGKKVSVLTEIKLGKDKIEKSYVIDKPQNINEAFVSSLVEKEIAELEKVRIKADALKHSINKDIDTAVKITNK